MKNINKDLYEINKKQRFGLRKFNGILVSALLGTSIYFISSNTQTVKADVIPDDPQDHQTQTEVKDTNINKTESSIDAKAQIDSYAGTVNDSNNTTVKHTDTSDTNKDAANSSNDAANNANISDTNKDAANSSNDAANNTDTSKDVTNSSNNAINNTDTSKDVVNSSTNATNNADTSKDVTNDSDKPKTKSITSGVTHNGINYSYDDVTNTLTIIGPARYDSFDHETLFSVPAQYIKTVKHVILTDKITLSSHTASGLFKGCSNLLDITGLENLDLSSETECRDMFQNCTSLTSLDLSNFDTHNISDMSNMFYNCASLTSLNLSSFDTQDVIAMDNMFAGCKALTSLDLSSFNTSRVGATSDYFRPSGMIGMFDGCESLTSLNLSNFDTTYVKSMNNMFHNCKSLTNLNLSSFVTSAVSNMNTMFTNCTSLTNLNLSNFDTTSVTNMSGMFSGCQSLTNVDLSHFNTSKVIDMSAMFYHCSSLNDLDLSNFDTSTVTSMFSMFEGCTSLTKLNVTSFNTDRVFMAMSMFKDCSKLTSLDLSNFNTESTSLRPNMSMDGFFTNDSNLRILKLGSQFSFSNKNTGLSTSPRIKDALWFKKGNGTINNPDPTQAGVTTVNLENNYNGTTDADTYLRGYEYQVRFLDKDNNDKEIPTTSQKHTQRVILANYADDADVNGTTPLSFTADANIQAIIASLQDKNYSVVINPFDPKYTPTETQGNIDVYLTHKKSQTREPVTRKYIRHYVDDNGKQIADDVVSEKQFDNILTTDLVTGIVTHSTAPAGYLFYPGLARIIKGYIADQKTEPEQTLTIEKDLEVKFLYHKTGYVIPVDTNGNVIAGLDKIQYTNSITDPTKVSDTIPTIKGYTVKPGQKLVDDATKDSKIIYLKNNATTIGFIDQDNNNQAITGIDPITSSTAVGQTIAKPTNIDTILADLTNKGYELVTDPLANGVIATEGTQVLNYIFKHKIEATTDTVTRKVTVVYVDTNGMSINEPQRDIGSFTFVRNGKKDLVTGVTVWNDWSADQKTPVTKNPVIKGYITKHAELEPQVVTHGDKDLYVYVTYKQLGYIIPVDKNGKAIAGHDKVIYENDPDDPTKIKVDWPTIPGYVPDKNAKVPTDPTKNTQVTYLQVNQTTIKFVDQDNNNQAINGIDAVTSSTDIGKPIIKPANVDQILTDLAAKGYEMVTDPFKNSVIATDGLQTLTYVFKHKQDNNQTDTVTRKQTVHFVDNNGKSLADDKVTEVKFTRTGVKDLVTGKINWSDWSKAQTLPEVKVPVINGYIANKAIVPSQVLDNTKDVESIVIYQVIGNYLPVDKNGKAISGKEKIPYENDPTDPTKIKTGLPTIDGYVPSKDAKVPTDPTKDTQVTYLENNKTTISFIDKDNGNQAINGIDSITSSIEIGKTIEKPANIDQIIKDLTDKGYELVADPFKDPIVATDGKQEINYVFKHKTDTQQSENITRKQTIHFVDSDGKSLTDDKVTEVKFTRTGIKDLVTGKITWSDWSKNQTLPEVKVPVIKGYLADKAVVSSTDITVDKDIETTVTYQKLGNYIPVDKDGNVIKGVDKIPYENDPDDPTKIKADQKLPAIKDRVTPNAIKPVDPTKDTKVTYDTASTKFQVNVHDSTINQDLPDYHWEDANAKVGEKVTYNWAKVKKDLLAHGYEIVQEPNIPDVYGSAAQTIVINVKHKVVTLDPDNPPASDSTINDNGVKWPNATEYNKLYEERIQFVDEQGNVLADPIVQKVRFSRKLQIDAVTGKILNPDSEWISASKTYQSIKIPNIAGYESPKQSKNGIKLIAGSYPEMTVKSENITDSIVYKKIPANPGTSGTDVTPTKPTPDDVPDKPNEPTKPVTPDNPIKPIKPTKPVKPAKPTPTKKPKSLIGHKVINTTGAKDSKIIKVDQVNKAGIAPVSTLPQTGTKKNSQQEEIALIALGFVLIGLSFGVKPKKLNE